MQEARNCGGEYRDGDSGAPILVLRGIEIRECPITLIDKWNEDMITLFFLCHSISGGMGAPLVICHSLPESGGLLDQDNVTIEAFTVIQNTLMRREANGG